MARPSARGHAVPGFIVWVRKAGKVLFPFCVLAASSLRADDPQKTFDAIFPDAQKVTQPKDRAALGAKLLTYAKQLDAQTPDDIALRAFILRKAYDFSLADAAGYDAAIESASLLREHDPWRARYWQDQHLRVAELKYRKSKIGPERSAAGHAYLELLVAYADGLFKEKQYNLARRRYEESLNVAYEVNSPGRAEIRKKLDITKARLAVKYQIEGLEKQLDEQKGGPAARALIVRLLTELDDPEQAEKYVADGRDEKLANIVKLARRPLTQLGEADAMELGDWYASFAPKASGDSLAVVGERASACYRRVLDLHSAADAQRLAATAALERVQKLLEVAATTQPAPTTKAR